jgi:mitochondrial fission protein ELM1
VNVLIIKDKNPGHYRQSEAVAAAIQEGCSDVHIEIVEGNKLKKLYKYVIRWCLHTKMFEKLCKGLLQKIYLHRDFEKNIPDVVISSGAHTAVFSAFLKFLHPHIFTIYIGHPRKTHHKYFDVIMSVTDLELPNQLILETAPTLPYREDIIQFCKTYGLNPKKHYALLLIGGNSKEYHYEASDWKALVTYVNETYSQIRWLISTSRRTPEEWEKYMKKHMRYELFVAYHENALPIAPLLALAENVFVTEDSASMISEAIAFGHKVIAVYPKKSKQKTTFEHILQKFEKENKMIRISIADMNNDFALQKNNMKILHKQHYTTSFESLKEKVCSLLQERKTKG